MQEIREGIYGSDSLYLRVRKGSPGWDRAIGVPNRLSIMLRWSILMATLLK